MARAEQDRVVFGEGQERTASLDGPCQSTHKSGMSTAMNTDMGEDLLKSTLKKAISPKYAARRSAARRENTIDSMYAKGYGRRT